MIKTQIQLRISAVREELEARYKYGTIKMASIDGQAIPTKTLQEEMFSLIYKLSKLLNEK